VSTTTSNDRVHVDGKFLRLGAQKFFLKGVTYGPFAPDESGCTFASREQTARDFAQILQLGANTLRVYYVPPRWFLDLAHEHALKVFVDIPWEKHRCFLETYEMREAAFECVRGAARACAGHPALLAFSVANEVPAEIARWHGAREVANFIDRLVIEVKAIDPGALCTFASFPPTEFLRPSEIDFVTFNVYLHERPIFESYLARLQTLANDKPLVLGEFGMDSQREGEDRKCDFLREQIECAFRGGVAGTVVFSFTDDWFRGAQQVTDWSFGLVTRDRKPKFSFAAVQSSYNMAPHFPLPRPPKVSVVVASYNGGKTLRTCLESLLRLNYPDYEIILVDDGSTDDTPKIAAEFPRVKTIRQENLGLSAARNTGIRAATGAIVAFTDSDCRADEDWLYYLVSDFLRTDYAAVGGHNFLPPEDSPVAAAVMSAPGGPVHVMITDREAEHIPGCNMAFHKYALEEINGFDPVFRKAGDDVDVCWRLQQAGYKIGFSPGAFVWHYRRATVKAYLRQQAGYGEAEALLAQKHPEYFNVLGNSVWHGRIYSSSIAGIVLQRPVIYHGIFGSAFFQQLFERQPSFALMVCTSLQFHLLVLLPLALLSVWWQPALPIFLSAILLTLGVAVVAGIQAALPRDRRRWWSRPLVAAMFLLQPHIRTYARFKQRLQVTHTCTGATIRPTQINADDRGFWSAHGADRYALLRKLHTRLDKEGCLWRLDSGWDPFDMLVRTTKWANVQLTTVQEELSGGRKFIRCRVRSTFSWLSWVGFAAVAMACAVAIVNLRAQFPLVWFLLAALPLAGGVMAEAANDQKQAVQRILDDATAELQLQPFDPATSR
jgi:O-antigen biosynthesis protein